MNLPSLLSMDDQQLIQLHLAGDSTAFRAIVERYQGMVCGLAYSACGDVARSEDVAQEVFVAAWKQLPQLREPAKLRAWLGGITRNLVHDSLRRAGRTATTQAVELSPQLASDRPDPSEEAIHSEQARLMWDALRGLPEIYREPMVLFYREHRSLETVAVTLEISEETVRQRLSRGRAMLTQRLAALVEETLERSAPKPAFVGAVLLAVSGVIPSAAMKAVLGTRPQIPHAWAKAGSAAGKTSLALKLFAAVAALPALLHGLTTYLRYRVEIEAANASADPGEIRRSQLRPMLWVVVAIICFGLVLASPLPARAKFLSLAVLVIGSLTLGYRREKNRQNTNAAGLAQFPGAIFEYRSSSGFLGLPWLHVRAGGNFAQRKAVGWIAISDGWAVGGIFAGAPLATAPLSVGGMTLGGFAISGIALGFGVLGAAAAGNWATGGFALAWHAAQGGVVLAHDYASGRIAFALHANDAVALKFFREHWFFRFTAVAQHVAVWAGLLGGLLPLLLIARSGRRATVASQR